MSDLSALIASTTLNPWVAPASISIRSELAGPAAAEVILRDESGGLAPVVGNSVEIQYPSGVTKLFSGSAQEVSRTKTDGILPEYRLSATDLSHATTRRITGEREWTGEVLATIVKNIVTGSLAGDLTDVSLVEVQSPPGPIIKSFSVSYATVKEAFDRLAELAGMRWYVNARNQLVFFTPSAASAPFSISSGTNISKLDIRQTREDYVNSVVARVGNALRDPATETFTGNGSERSFAVAFPIQNVPEVHVNGVTGTVGIADVDTGVDWYWAQGSKEIRQDSGGVALSTLDTLSVTYEGTEQIYVSAENVAEIAARATAEGNSGKYMKLIELNTDLTKADAKAAAAAYLARYDALTYVASIETNDYIEPACVGTRPGQIISITIPGYGTTGTFLVRSVVMSHMESADDQSEFQWLVRIEAVKGPILRTYADIIQDKSGAGNVTGSGALIGAGVGVGGLTPGDVTITSISYEYADADRVRVRIAYTPPSPLGPFVGVHVFEEPRDVSSTPGATLDGTTLLDGSANLGGDWAPVDRGKFPDNPVVLLIDAARTTIVHRFYLDSYSEGAEAELVRANKPSPTPSITISIAPVVYQSGVEYAHLILDPAATVEYDDSQVASPKYRIRFTWTAPLALPAVWQRAFGGNQIVYEYADARRANGPALAVNEIDATSDWYDLYVGTSTIRCWFDSYDNSDDPRVNTIVEGVTPFADVTVTWPLATRPPEAKYADNVTGFVVSNARYSTNGAGQKVLLLDWTWVPPVGAAALARWGGSIIYLFIPGVLIPYQITGAESGSSGVMEFGQFPVATESWVFWSVGTDNNGNLNTDPAAPAVGTPTFTISVSPPEAGPVGTEWTSLVTGASFAVSQVLDSNGATAPRITATFTPPADVTWGGAEFRIYDGSTLVSRVSVTASPAAITLPNPDSSLNYTVKLVSFDVNGRVNSETGATPQGTVLVGSTAGTLDIRKFLPASTNNFAIVGSYLQIKTGVAITVDGSGLLRVAVSGIDSSLIAAGAVGNAAIINGAIDDLKLAAAAVTAAKIAAGAVTSPAIAASAVTAGKIAALSIVAGDIAADAITAAKILAGSITTVKIAAGAVTATEIAALAIVAGKIAANAVTATEIATDAIIAGKILAGAVTASKVATNAISSDKLDATVINVGGGGSKPGKFYVWDAAGSLMGFIGVDSGLSAFQINYNGTTTTISNGLDGNLSEYVGLKVAINSGGGYSMHSALSFAVFATNNTTVVAQLTRAGTGGGVMKVSDQATGNTITCTASFPRIVVQGATNDTRISDGAISINGSQVVGPRGASVSNTSSTAGATYGATEQTMINDLKATCAGLISRLQTHGLTS